MKADRDEVMPLLKTAKGHIEGIIRMVEDDRYCMDIVTQLLAVEAIIKKTNKVVLKAHLLSCVRSSIETGDTEDKIEELLSILNKIMK